MPDVKKLITGFPAFTAQFLNWNECAAYLRGYGQAKMELTSATKIAIPKIFPDSQVKSYLQFRLKGDVSKEQIERVLGFKPNIKDDPSKVSCSWGFTVDGKVCAIWDWKFSRWSCRGPREIFEELFPGKVEA